MRKAEERVCGSGSQKLQSGYALLAFLTPGSISALVGIHLKKEKSCLKKGTTSVGTKKDSRGYKHTWVGWKLCI